MKSKNINGLCNIKILHGNGNHLILDGFVKDNSVLTNLEFVTKFIQDLTIKVGMTPISDPLVIDYKAKSQDRTQNGITGTIILAESNITIHTYPKQKFFCLDIFSCNEFEIDETIKYLEDSLQITSFKKKLLKRGFYNGQD